MTPPNDWSRYEQMVLAELKRLCTEQKEMRNELKDVRADVGSVRVSIEGQRVRVGLWGAISGAISGLVTAGVLLWRLAG